MNRARLARAGLVFLGALPLAAQEYPTRPPSAGPLRPAPFPPSQEVVLPNGARLIVVENRKQPIVSFSLSFAAGSRYDPAGKEGLASMAAALLTKGAGSRSADQFATTVEGTGGSLSASAGPDFLTLDGSVLTPSLGTALELAADAILRPAFASEELDLLRTQTLSALQLELSQPATIAGRWSMKSLYGDHPYGRAPTPASVRAIAREDLSAFQKAHLRPSGALMVFAGDVDLATARQLVLRSFDGWLGAPPPQPKLAAPPARTASEIVLVHRPGSVQSNIVAGNLTYAPTDPRHYAAVVANRVLGSGADSRLFQILREQKGWTYGAYSALERRQAIGYFEATAEVRTEVTDSSLRELLNQLARIGSEPVPAAELEAAKGFLVGSYPLVTETADQVAGAITTARLYGLADDYIQTYRVKLGAVTAEEAAAAAKSVIRPQQAAIVVVGDGAKVYDRIRDIAPVRIIDPEGKPLTPADLTAKAAALPLMLDRLVARQDSFAIMVQGNAFGAMTLALEKTPDGFRVTEATRIGGFVDQRTEVIADQRFRASKVTQAGKVRGQETKIEVSIEGGRARGTAVTPDPKAPATLRTIAIDTAVAEETLDENLVQSALAALPWAEGAKWAFEVFSSGTGEFRQVVLAVTGTESVTTPAGTETCYKAEFTGGAQAVTFWVTTGAPHRLMKIAIAGAPIEMVRVK